MDNPCPSHEGQDATLSHSPKEDFRETGSHMPGKHKWTLSSHRQGHQLRGKTFFFLVELKLWLFPGKLLCVQSQRNASPGPCTCAGGAGEWPTPVAQAAVEMPRWVPLPGQSSTQPCTLPGLPLLWGASVDAPALRYGTHCSCHPHP